MFSFLFYLFIYLFLIFWSVKLKLNDRIKVFQCHVAASVLLLLNNYYN